MLPNVGLCWTIFTRNRDTAVPAEKSILVARPRRCSILSNPVPWQNWMAAYLGYTLRMKTLFRGWPVMVHDKHTWRMQMCSWNLPCALSLGPSVLHPSHGFHCSPILNCQPYDGRLPLTSQWSKLSNMTVGQSSLISFTHHFYDWHPESHCDWTCNQLTPKVDGDVTRSQLRLSTLTLWPTPQSGNQVLISLGNSGLYWTVFAWNRDTAVVLLQ